MWSTSMFMVLLWSTAQILYFHQPLELSNIIVDLWFGIEDWRISGNTLVYHNFNQSFSNGGKIYFALILLTALFTLYPILASTLSMPSSIILGWSEQFSKEPTVSRRTIHSTHCPSQSYVSLRTDGKWHSIHPTVWFPHTLFAIGYAYTSKMRVQFIR